METLPLTELLLHVEDKTAEDLSHLILKLYLNDLTLKQKNIEYTIIVIFLSLIINVYPIYSSQILIKFLGIELLFIYNIKKKKK